MPNHVIHVSNHTEPGLLAWDKRAWLQMLGDAQVDLPPVAALASGCKIYPGPFP